MATDSKQTPAPISIGTFKGNSVDVRKVSVPLNIPVGAREQVTKNDKS